VAGEGLAAGPPSLALQTFISLQELRSGASRLPFAQHSGELLLSGQLCLEQRREQMEGAQQLQAGFKILVVVCTSTIAWFYFIDASLKIVISGQGPAQLGMVDACYTKVCSLLLRAYSSGL